MRISVFFAAILICGHVAADEKGCDEFATLAHSIMEGRQNGVPMKASMAIAENSKLDDKIKAVVKSIVIDAYGQSRYSTEKMQQRVISDFEDSVYLACVKS